MTAAKNIAIGHLLIAISELHNLIAQLAENRLAIETLSKSASHTQQALTLAESQQFNRALSEVQAALAHYYDVPAYLTPLPDALIAAKWAIETEIRGRTQ
ncbi:MAG: hypothetical protein HC888_12235 [Candidatus Competibacteraceae bacterium]|nr:hypothetical protein [Candidatus Competibacteraceae bacterium]